MANRIPNPDFEDTSLFGWIAQQSGVVITSVPSRTGLGAQAVTPGVAANEGIQQNVGQQPTWNPIPQVGDTVRYRAEVKVTPAGATMQVQLVERDAANTLLTSAQTVFVATGDYQVISGNYSIVNPACVKVTLKVTTQGTIQAVVAIVDNVYLDAANWIRTFFARRRRR